jgi:hypothetical protein
MIFISKISVFKRLSLIIPFLLLCASVIFACSTNDIIPDDKDDDEIGGIVDEPDKKTEDNIVIANIVINNPLNVTQGETVTIKGKGFLDKDVVTITSVDDASVKFSSTVVPVGERSGSLSFPDEIFDGNYVFTLTREGKKIFLLPYTNAQGDTIGGQPIKINVKYSIPDSQGFSLVGKVHCNGVGIAGVNVSDCSEVVQTDKNGYYYIKSKKKYKNVYVSIPGGYEMLSKNGNVQMFYSKVDSDAPDKQEQVNFSLKKVDNNKHVMLAMSDFHLAKRTNDINQFSDFAKNVNLVVREYEKLGYKVYAMSMGDESWDLYWYSNSFGLPESFNQIKNIDVPFFHCMGNHDNDAHCIMDDWGASAKFLQVCGPSFYSFNIGRIHYIILDDIKYNNLPIEGGSNDNLMGDRKYDKMIVCDQIEWLKKDLALISDKSTPIVIGMHSPLAKTPRSLDNAVFNGLYDLKNASEFVDCLNGFSNVTILTGHVHECSNHIISESIVEHNIGAVCGTWWWTGKLVNNYICKDGSPSGFETLRFDDREKLSYYQGIGFERDYQFRSYDMNEVYIRPADFTGNTDHYVYFHDYTEKKMDNDVLINVWNYNPKWKIEVTETLSTGEKVALNVSQVLAYDPLHILSYNAQRVKAGSAPTGDFQTQLSTHFFKVKATEAKSDITIKVTDDYGVEYRETMKRPKKFNVEIK